MAPRISGSGSDPRTLFTTEDWREIETSPNAHVAPDKWQRFTPEQRSAIKHIQRTHAKLQREHSSDGPAKPPRQNDRDRAALQGGSQGAPLIGRTAKIHEIQGTGSKSPFENQNVTTQGVVTGIDGSGFFIQEPNQGLEEGSPGLYVFTGGHANVAAGDEVNVSGLVTEFNKNADDFPDASMTQLKAEIANIEVKSVGNPIPEVIIGKGGIELSHTESNEPLWEKLEGVRVRINDVVVTGAPNDLPRLSDMAVVPDGGAGAGKRTVGGGLVRDTMGNPSVVPVRMKVDNLGAVDVGARMPKGLAGNVIERHGHHQVLVESSGGAENLIASPMKAEVSDLRSRYPSDKNVLFIASLNGENKDTRIEEVGKVQDASVVNVDDDVGDGKLRRMAEQIVKNLTSPDIVAMQEIQDNDGAELSDVTDASVTWKAIIEEIVKLGGPRYEWVDRPPVNGAEGGQPGGNIRNGFLYNPDRVTLKKDSVYRLEDPAYANTRVPLVATFEFKHDGETEVVTLQSVHNTSKRGRTPEEASERQVAQSAVINKWAREHAPKNDHEHIGVFGDRNAYTDEAAIQKEIEGDVLELLSMQLPEEDRYSAQYGGSSGELDHATAKSSVPIAIDLVHMNSDFDERFRSSDHDGTLTAWDFRRGKK